MGKSFAKFAMSEAKRHYQKKGPSDTQKKWMAIEKSFAIARECIREREAQVNRWVEDGREAYELVEYIREGGEPY